MFKIISSEEYVKLIGDIDYWKALALREENRKNFYENICKEKQSIINDYEKDNAKLRSDYEDLNRAKKLADEVIRIVNKEHHCNRNCFAEHVLLAIQKDYDNKMLEFMLDHDKKYYFLKYWNKKLKNEYDFIENLYMIDDTIMVRFK